MVRNINFISPILPSALVLNEELLNATGSESVFDDAINQIQNDINRLTDRLVGDVTKGIPSMDTLINEAYTMKIHHRNLRDKAPRRSNHPDRVYHQQEMDNFDRKYNNLIEEKENLIKIINDLKTIDLPAAIALKEKHGQEKYNQSFASKGIDVKSQQLIKKAEADALRLKAESAARVQEATQKAQAELAETSTKTTRNIVILVVVAIIVTSIIIIIRKRKQK